MGRWDLWWRGRGWNWWDSSAVTSDIGGGCVWAGWFAGLVSKFLRWAGEMDRESGGLSQTLLLSPHVLLNLLSSSS